MAPFTTCNLLICAFIATLTTAGLPSSHENGYTYPDICPRSPLLVQTQTSLNDWQCTNTTHPQVPPESGDQEQDQQDTSAGWTGPHACAGIYCVYTHPTFASHRGISLLTDDTTANTLANLPLFITLADPHTAASFLATANINTQSPHVETRPIPGKGRGLVVKRDDINVNTPLYRGQQVMAYTPALIFHRAMIDDLPRHDQLALLSDAVSRLPKSTRRAFWKQLSQTGDENEHDILKIIMTNSFNLPTTPAVVGNFPEVSMYNHACRPNTAFHLAHGGFIHRTTIAAAPSVPAGEELSIAYLDVFRVHAVRNARALRNWGFTCACAACTAGGPAARNASDHRLWRMHELETSLAVLRGEGRRERQSEQDEMDRIALLVSLYRQESLLDAYGAGVYRVAAMVCSAWQRKELVVKWALLALDAYLVQEGELAGGVQEMVALLDSPEGHWSWGRRLA